ncbi:poly(A) polymerase [Legionella geestiana]|uniref:Poly(A) polymerase I n=1 Tax=Legionella geestiana TaxID=45065 RepID=A0A0W0U8M1_9GAMM|nr:polynucleotide adenylyltransferase PcnB [Legionella geestiana]KTD04240.1 poly(A) polymerase [Legionella geestiana]STX53655.1 poly(A) polymerase [Legionella geestiana]
MNAKYIIPRQNHCLSKTDISPNALSVLNRLNSAGHEAYLVGGSVRDLLLKKAPKDFDVATSATPNQIKRLFRNARIIGRRFKLVHIIFHREIIEVATFRGNDRGEGNAETTQQVNDRGMLIRDNAWGTLEEDVFRRDFTVNSLYYNLRDASIVDYTGGVADTEARCIRMIGDPTTRYQEDPVRMLRAIRFSAKLHFTIEENTAAPIRALGEHITHVSGSRLFDEMTKLYQCGEGESVQRLLTHHGLFDHLFPQTAKLLHSEHPVNALIGIALENTDIRIRDDKPVNPAFLYAVLLWFPLKERARALQETGMDPLPALEKAMSLVVEEQNRIVTIPKRFSQVMREIWLLQFRFPKRLGGRAFNLLHHPRFRAAYDFLGLRALAGDEDMSLASWWTRFQDEDAATQEAMVAELSAQSPKKPRRRRRSKPAAPEAS